jgi:phospholipid/cholesterol/gamma-HCH transport system substrate-binding protein
LKISREVKIAVVFIVALALFFWGFNFLKGRDVFKKQRIFYAVYDQINGLEEANPVVVNGFKIGHVKNIYFHPDSSGRVVVEFLITNSDIRIPKNSIARLYSSDIMGSRAIEIKLGSSSSTAGSGDTLKTILGATLGEEFSNQMLPIKNKFENVMSSIDSVLVIIQSIFNEGTRKNLLLSFESIKLTIQNLEHTTFNIDTLVTTQKYKLSSIIGNVESITSNIKKNNDKIANIITNFSNISDTLAKARISSTISNADKALADFSEIMGKVKRGEGSLGMLVNNDSLYRNIESSSVQLDQLIEDIKLNPKRYVHFSVFGTSKKNGEYKPPQPK